MKMGERTINNALFNAGSSILPLALSLVFWPYIVATLGESPYGIYALVGSIIGYFSLLDLGLGNAVIKYVAEYTGQQDDKQTEDVIAAALSIFLIAGLAGFAVILATANILVTKFLKIPPELMEMATYSFYATSLGFFFTMQLTLFTSIANGLNRYDISSITLAVLGMLTTLGAVILLRQGFGLISLVWLNVFLPLLAVVFYLVLLRRLLPQIHLRLTIRPKIMKRLLHFGMYSILSRATAVIMCQLAPLIIGSILGLAAVTYYVIPFTILSRMTVLIIRAGTVIFPTISELQGRQENGAIRDLYLTSSRMILSFSTASTVCLLIFGIRFLSLWMSPEFAERGGGVLLLITLGVFIDQCTNVPCFVVNGLGRPKLSGLMSVCRAAIFLALIVPGAVYWGIVGVAAAFVLSNAVVSPFFIWFVSCNVLDIPLRQLVKEVYLRPLLAAALVAPLLLLAPQDKINHIFVLLAVMGGGMGLYFSTALLIGVYHKRERKVLWDYLNTSLSRIIKK